MRCVELFRQPELSRDLVREIARSLIRPVRIMEVCGTHTMAIFRHGIRSLLPEGIRLMSGPGCPVCVTPSPHIDACVAAARMPGVTVATFGDLVRVPGSGGSLAGARANGARVEIVYSPMDALALAQKEPDRTVVFPAIGFETTVPTIAATLIEARRQQIGNFFIIPAAKTMPGALAALMADPELRVDGLLCPGHVSAIIGAQAYQPLVDGYGLACAVAGFEPADLLSGLLSLIRQITRNQPTVENCYSRVVSPQGNPRAQALINEVFEPADSPWRGLGVIPASGLVLRGAYRSFDALVQLGITLNPAVEPRGCRCGDILKGLANPVDCPLFGTVCTQTRPVGPCMVSSEGSCAAHARYGGYEQEGAAQAHQTTSTLPKAAL